MDLKRLFLSLACFSNNGPIILQSVAPAYAYGPDRKRTDKIEGLRVTVVFPGNRLRHSDGQGV